MKRTNGLIAAALCCNLLTATTAVAAETQAVETPRLELSRTLTLAPTGSPPISPLATPAATPVLAPDSSPGFAGRWLLLLALIPALLWWRWRASAPPPAVAAVGKNTDLQTLIARNTALDDDLRRAHAAGRGEWDSTVTSLRADLATARGALDRQRDQTNAHRHDASDAQAKARDIATRLEQSDTQLREQSRAREFLERELTDARAHIKSSEANAANAAARAQESVTETLRQRDEIAQLVAQIRQLQETQQEAARKLEHYREQARDHEAANIKHRAEIDWLGNDLAQSQTACEHRDGQIDELKSRLANKDQEMAVAAQDHQTVLAELREQSRNLRVGRDDKAGRVNELESEATQRKEEIDRIAAQRDALVADHSAQRSRHEKALLDQTTRSATLETQLDEQRDAYRRLCDERESETKQRDEESSATAAQLSEQLASTGAERDRLRQVLADASAELRSLQQETAGKIEDAERRAALAESSAREAREQWQDDRRSTQEAKKHNAKAVAVAEAAAGDLTRGLADAQARIAELDMALRQKTKRIAELDEELASASAEASSTDEQLTALLDSVQEYKESTRNKIVNIAKKFDAMLIQRNELKRQLQMKHEQHADNDDLEQIVAEKDKIIARLGDDLDNSRKVIDALKSSADSDEQPAVNQSPEIRAFDAVRRDLTQAQQNIKSLEADLRVRNDLIRAYEENTSEMPQLEDELASRASTIAVLENELSLAVAELARAKSAAPESFDADQLDKLQKQLSESQKHGARQAEVIAHLEEELVRAVPPETVEDHLRQIDELQQDLRASSSLIRHLEQEVANLRSDGPRALPDAG